MEPLITVERLSQINQEIQRIDNEKQQREQTLAAFWEHLPPIDPKVVAKAMQELQDRIRALEDRKQALLQELQSLIATFKITFDAPSELVALSNMPIIDEKLDKDVKTYFEQTRVTLKIQLLMNQNLEPKIYQNLLLLPMKGYKSKLMLSGFHRVIYEDNLVARLRNAKSFRNFCHFRDLCRSRDSCRSSDSCSSRDLCHSMDFLLLYGLVSL
ncbi:hypothetical protein JRO89_XS09G0211700 [Xanthoceras sorbifolium]|uniref:Uncharacterized protein n=1 Tax=Xanthoceras sorbifolium TaxID=99658 RepID=A0ABQ8HM92_9ROSI|nr:hypothetical protein JRO89_XS09G0211700 [Xanthoceras sorbifolium]